MENLKDYMLLFRAELQPGKQMTQEEMLEMKQSWGNWIGGIAQKARLVSSHQLGFQGKVMYADGINETKLYLEDKKMVSGNLVLKAKDMEEAEAMAKNCPIFKMGGVLEIRDTLNVF